MAPVLLQPFTGAQRARLYRLQVVGQEGGAA
jgi:hypothetical protein